MKTPGNEFAKLEGMLKRTYQRREPPELDPRWRSRLMTRIREIGPLEEKVRFLPSFEKLVWRLAPVTVPLVLILVFFLLKLGLCSGPDALHQLVNSVEEWTLAQLLAV